MDNREIIEKQFITITLPRTQLVQLPLDQKLSLLMSPLNTWGSVYHSQNRRPQRELTWTKRKITLLEIKVVAAL